MAAAAAAAATPCHVARGGEGSSLRGKKQKNAECLNSRGNRILLFVTRGPRHLMMLRTSAALMVAATAADAFAGTTGFMPTSAGACPARSALALSGCPRPRVFRRRVRELCGECACESAECGARAQPWWQPDERFSVVAPCCCESRCPAKIKVRDRSRWASPWILDLVRSTSHAIGREGGREGGSE